MGRETTVTGVERFFDDNDIIVSKTDLKGRITYANDVFQHIAGYTERELMGQPHSIIRHPDMPRCVFKLLWDTIEAGSEIFAYVINRCKNGDHYWVHAHVTPTRDRQNNIIGYHSNRRVPDKRIVTEHIIPLYKSLLEVENKYENRKEGMQAGLDMVTQVLKEQGKPYEEFIALLQRKYETTEQTDVL